MKTKEAIERVKARFDKWSLDEEDLAALQALGLVSIESEDERTRKELLDYIKYNKEHTPETTPGEHWDRWITYLEKQKEENDKRLERVEQHSKRVQELDAKIKSLRRKIYGNEQKPAEWREGTKKALDKISDYLKYKGREEDADFIKHLRPQPHWKPSEQQMDAFYVYLYQPQYINNSEDERLKLVESLYNDLQKLL